MATETMSDENKIFSATMVLMVMALSPIITIIMFVLLQFFVAEPASTGSKEFELVKSILIIVAVATLLACKIILEPRFESSKTYESAFTLSILVALGYEIGTIFVTILGLLQLFVFQINLNLEIIAGINIVSSTLIVTFIFSKARPKFKTLLQKSKFTMT